MSWAYTEDASGFKGHTDRVAVPRDEAELIAVLDEARAARIPVTISGAGTGLAGGRVAQGGWTLSTERFQRIEIHDGWATAGSGVSLADLQAAARPSGQFYPPDPTETLASLGGTVACNASGSRSFLYGATREWLRRLRVVLMDGRVLDVRRGDRLDFDVPALPRPGTKKVSCGFPLQPGMDWIDLFTGSEGILGIVTEVEVGLLPIPQALLNGVVFFPDEERTLNAIDAWRPIPGLRMLEFACHQSLRLIAQRFPEIPAQAQGAAIIEQIVSGESDFDLWSDRLAAGGALEHDSWFGTSDGDRERFRRFRHALPESVNDACRRNGFMKLGSDYAVPLERHREMIRYYRAQCDPVLDDRYVIYGHIGDAHVHLNMLPASQADFDNGKALMVDFARKAVELGGTVAAEHGLGKRKAHLLKLQYTSEQISQMAEVKRRLDPDWLLGRGNLLDVPPEFTQ